MTPPRVTVTRFGDSALLARAYGGDAESRWRLVQRIADRLEAAPPTGLDNLVATYDSLLVEYDPDETGHGPIERRLLEPPPDDGAPPRPGRLFRVPVAYGGAYGPDLPDVAGELNLTPDEVVRLHTGIDWVVRFRGSPAAAPMLDGSPLPGPVRRCDHPRTVIEPGSVAVAGLQGTIYPVRSPGGWRLIGRTPLRLVDLGRRPPTPYGPGDRIRFVAIGAERLTELADRPLEPTA